jgi:hypothetical protein
MDVMKKQIILLTALIISLVAGGNLLAGNLLLNPGFEAGNTGWFGNGVPPDTNPRLVIPNWTFWGTDGWCHSNAGAFIDTRAILIWSDGPGVFQDVAVTQDVTYNFSVSAISLSSDSNGLHGRDGVFQIEWYDVDNYLIYAEEIGRFYGATDSGVVDPYNTWKTISGTRTAPIPATRCRVFIHIVGNGGAVSSGSVSWDNVFAGTGSSCGTSYLPGDVNKDCYVNFKDFALMAENWLKCNDVFNSNCH